MEMEASDRGVGSAAVGEERRFGCVRIIAASLKFPHHVGTGGEESAS